MKRVIFVPFTTHEAAAQLIANDSVDTILEAHVPVMKSLLARFPNKITTFSGDKPPYGNTDWWQTSLFFNHAQKQFQDVRIRRAISLYLNRKQAVDYAYQGAAAIYGMIYPALSPAAKSISTTWPTPSRGCGIIDYDAGGRRRTDERGGRGQGWLAASGPWTASRSAAICTIPISLDAIAPIIAEQLRRAGFKVARQHAARLSQHHLLRPRRLVALGPRRIGERPVPDPRAVSQAHLASGRRERILALTLA